MTLLDAMWDLAIAVKAEHNEECLGRRLGVCRVCEAVDLVWEVNWREVSARAEAPPASGASIAAPMAAEDAPSNGVADEREEKSQ